MSFILHYKNIYCSPLFADAAVNNLLLEGEGKKHRKMKVSTELSANNYLHIFIFFRFSPCSSIRSLVLNLVIAYHLMFVSKMLTSHLVLQAFTSTPFPMDT